MLQVQLTMYTKQGSSSYAFIKNFTAMWDDCKVKDIGSTKNELKMDVKLKGGEEIDKYVLRNRIYQSLKHTIFVFHVGDLKIGKPMKCSTCNGTGKSYFPKDIFAHET